MKTKNILIAMAILMSSLYMNSQSKSRIDSLEQKINSFEYLTQSFEQLSKQTKDHQKRVDNIQLNLDKCHKQFRAGIGVTTAGVAIGVISLIMIDYDFAIPLAITGLVVEVTGGWLIFNSHKFIGRAGINSISINF